MHWKKEQINRKLIKELMLVFCFLIAINAMGQNNNIDYKISKTVQQLIDTSESVYFSNIRKNEILYAKFSFYDRNTLISLSTTSYGSELHKLITLSNRFLIISETKKIPIIFDFDIDFSTLLNDSVDGNYQFGGGGFMVVFDKSGKIIKYGGQQ